ncbi:MAG: phosphate transporter permease subunit PstC, partial [Cyanobacteriota bacterium]
MKLPSSQQVFAYRNRPPQEKLVDQGFRQVVVVLASVVGVVLLGILLTVLSGSREAMASFGLGFLTTSDWDPVTERYGAFTAIYGTVVTSILALLIAVPLGVGTAVFITENLIPLRIRQVLGVMV